MSVLDVPSWYLTPIPIVFGKWGGVFLQDPETVPPFLAVKMIPHAVPGTQGPRASYKG